MRQGEQARALSRLAATGLMPLADVVFLLVIFFMLATSFTDKRFAQLSLAPSRDSSALEEALTVRLVGKGIFVLAGAEMDAAALKNALRSQTEEVRKSGLRIVIGEEAVAQDLADMVFIAQGAGFSAITTEASER